MEISLGKIVHDSIYRSMNNYALHMHHAEKIIATSDFVFVAIGAFWLILVS